MIDDDRPGSHQSNDDFWGSTPDWSDAAERPRRKRRAENSSDITGAIKNLWGAAMSGGASATRSHGVFDATAPRPADAPDFEDAAAPGVRASTTPDPAMFDDLDEDIDLGATTEVPVTRARRRRAAAAANSVDPAVVERTVVDPADVDPVGPGRRIDPLLARVGAVAIATTLLVPLAIGLQSGDSADTITSADIATSLASVAEFPPPPASAEPTAPAPVGAVPLDPSSLPPAIPATSGDRSETGVSSDTPSTVTTADGGESTADRSSNSAAIAAGSLESKNSDGAEASADPVCAIDYVVQSGDYWIGLADGAGVPLTKLFEANSANASTPLYPGADICLPAGSSTPSTTPPATTTPATTAAPATAAPTTTAAPATTTAAPAPSPAGPEEIKQIIRDVWPDELEDRALQIAYRESRYSPTAKNYCCYGLFQIYWEVHDSWLDDIGVTSASQLYDPTINARAAYALYQRAGGWGPWAQTNY